MKKRFFAMLAAVMCCIMIWPVTVNAKVYQVGETDMSITIDDEYWYVFTRDNIKDNPELAELGVSYSDMYDILQENKMYVDALLFYDDGSYMEFGVRKTNIDKIVNLANYDDDKVMELADKLAELHDVKTYSIYENQYKFIRFDYTDGDYYVCEYITVINGDNYTLTFQETVPFVDSEYDEIQTIVDSVRFNIDASLKEPSQSSLSEGLGDAFIRGAVTAAVLGIGGLIFGKKKKKGETTGEETPEEVPEEVKIEEYIDQMP